MRHHNRDDRPLRQQDHAPPIREVALNSASPTTPMTVATTAPGQDTRGRSLPARPIRPIDAVESRELNTSHRHGKPRVPLAGNPDQEAAQSQIIEQLSGHGTGIRRLAPLGWWHHRAAQGRKARHLESSNAGAHRDGPALYPRPSTDVRSHQSAAGRASANAA